MKLKSLISGIIIGAMLTLTVTVFADVQLAKVEAWLSDTVSIIVDGNAIDIPEDMHILNYEGRVYTPARLIAEEFGGTVEWSEGRNAVVITKPDPEIVEVEREKIIEIESRTQYDTLPQRLIVNNFTLSLAGIKNDTTRTMLYVDAKNENYRDVAVDYRNAYIMVNDKKYNAIQELNYVWGNSVAQGQSIEGEVLPFDSIPLDAKEITICIPVVFREFDEREGLVDSVRVYTFNVIVEEL